MKIHLKEQVSDLINMNVDTRSSVLPWWLMTGWTSAQNHSLSSVHSSQWVKWHGLQCAKTLNTGLKGNLHSFPTCIYSTSGCITLTVKRTGIGVNLNEIQTLGRAAVPWGSWLTEERLQFCTESIFQFNMGSDGNILPWEKQGRDGNP